MKKFTLMCIGGIMLTACASHDPILPGVRTSVFTDTTPEVLGTPVPNAPEQIIMPAPQKCPYTQDASNVIWDGERKVFSGFPTSNSVKSVQTPVCAGNYVYAGLTTGELVKVNPKSRSIAWVADIYRPSNMTGGASVLDIIAPIVVRGNDVYVGGLGDAFCRINAETGNKKWCTEIGVGTAFLVDGAVAYVVATDDYLYAIRIGDGAIYWRTEIDRQITPTYSDGMITVGKQKINATSGEIID